MASPERVESFQIELEAEQLPPHPQWVAQQLSQALAHPCLQWAIVRTEGKRLWIEGSQLVFSQGANR